ncbi:hypothetical protein FKR81_09340 [Lentzea tibetensis]|uniref:Uncharacterized protein n=1 Tax=Lentzea tibetensis TaxID=2591470 RepID=A0A563EYA4_9PSEU|nr:hypothetical protein [Lentzea tibetensis]TWP52518.1 hypothetical protein FKR81_09340 [Lentzea tibetensis]
MSTVLYAQRTVERYAAAPDETSKPALVLDSVAALVPAEVLAAHALIVPMLTEKATTPQGEVVTIISGTNAATLSWVFWALLALASGVFLVGRMGRSAFGSGDVLRVLIPPAAFVCWTMLQQSTVFDGAFPSVDTGARNAGAVLGAIALGVLAGVLAYTAAQTDPNAPVDAPAHALTRHALVEAPTETTLNGHLPEEPVEEDSRPLVTAQP